eukprot:UN01181
MGYGPMPCYRFINYILFVIKTIIFYPFSFTMYLSVILCVSRMIHNDYFTVFFFSIYIF